jgi:hypothetical protein
MKFLFLFFILISRDNLILTNVLAAKTKMTPEQEAAFFGKHLKPISDDEWKITAGARITEKYAIIQGDTLYDISKRLFGDAKYWPKIWALNNENITNPHRIRPGNLVAFSAGTGSTLPSVALMSGSNSPPQSSVIDAPVASPEKTALRRSTDWENFPKQSWENYHLTLPPEVDPLGFDKRNKIQTPKSIGFEAQAVPASGSIPFLGEITGSRSESQYLTLHDMAYIKADDNLQIGQVYAVTQEPSPLKSKKLDRTGYSYPILGKVKILGVRDRLFIGRIIANRGFLPRGSSLILLPPKVPDLTPIPGPKPIQGSVLLDRNFSTYTAAQHKEVYIDRGTEDGIQPGMVFRAYQHQDPGTEKKLTESDFIIDADLLVTQVSPQFSSALIIRSISPIVENAKVVLLTDVSDLLQNQGFREKGDAIDELDQLDDDDSLGKDEKRELRQLEKWQSNPTPSSAPSPEPSESPPMEIEDDAKKPETVPNPLPGDDDNIPAASDDMPPPPPTAGEGPEPVPTPNAEDGLPPVPPTVDSPGESLPPPADIEMTAPDADPRIPPAP